MPPIPAIASRLGHPAALYRKRGGDRVAALRASGSAFVAEAQPMLAGQDDVHLVRDIPKLACCRRRSPR